MNVYCPAGITSALGGVENGDAKHMLAATVTANKNGTGLTPICPALCNAIGAISTAVTVLLINIVINDVVKYTPAIKAKGPYAPRPLTIVPDIYSDAPVFSNANYMGNMAANNTIVSQLIVL